MEYKYKHIILRSIKIGVGATLAIIIASCFKLDYPSAAGTITNYLRKSLSLRFGI